MATEIRGRHATKAAVLIAGFALLWTAMPAVGSTLARTHKRSAGGAGLYWGAQIGSQMTGAATPWDMRGVYKFAHIAGKGLSLVEFGAPFKECIGGLCALAGFPATPLENVRRYGAIPVVSWSSASDALSLEEPDFRLSALINGNYDSYIRYFATRAMAWGHPFFLRFDWEMNGSWFPWSEGANGNHVGEYVAAWRHVHDIFTSVGATNATWVWCPNVDIYGQLRSLQQLYPGNAYVDWTCLDGYNWGKRRGSPGWLSFNSIYRSTYEQIISRIAPRKPMLLAEIASSDRGGSKAAWITGMLKAVPHWYRKIGGVVWYDVEDRGAHWPIETSSSAKRAFRAGIRSDVYVGNDFGGLLNSPIRRPPVGRSSGGV